MLAAFAEAAAPTPALQAVDDGDRAWWGGDRALGVRRWREAAELADGSPEGHAAALMAHLRLMNAGTTLSPLVHGRAITRAVDGCYEGDVTRGAWCRLAVADYWLMAPPPTGDRDTAVQIARSLLSELPGPAASRLALAGDRAPLEALAPDQRDGLGEALLAGPEWTPGPTVVGLGFLAGSPTGIGLGLHLDSADVGRKQVRLTADAFGAWRAAGLTGSLETPGAVGFGVDAALLRWPWWDGEGFVPVDTARVAAGPIFRKGGVKVEAGPLARWDVDGGDTIAGHGFWTSAAFTTRWNGWFGPLDLRATAGSEVALPPLADYGRAGGPLQLAVSRPLGPGVVAARIRVEQVFGDAVPDVRLATVGGAYVLRGARYGELRGERTTAADLELRQPLWRPMWCALFADAAAVEGEGTHGGGGVGLRMVLPPEPRNTIRLDLGVTDVGWGVYVAWGEAF